MGQGVSSRSGSVDEMIIGSVSDADRLTGFQEADQTPVRLDSRQQQILEASVKGDILKLQTAIRNGGYTPTLDQVSHRYCN